MSNELKETQGTVKVQDVRQKLRWRRSIEEYMLIIHIRFTFSVHTKYESWATINFWRNKILWLLFLDFFFFSWYVYFKLSSLFLSIFALQKEWKKSNGWFYIHQQNTHSCQILFNRPQLLPLYSTRAMGMQHRAKFIWSKVLIAEDSSKSF